MLEYDMMPVLLLIASPTWFENDQQVNPWTCRYAQVVLTAFIYSSLPYILILVIRFIIILLLVVCFDRPLFRAIRPDHYTQRM